MKVSIIIPSYNGRHLLKQNLNSLKIAVDYWERRDRGQHEIIVVDDASSDGTSEWLGRHHPDVRLVRNARNLRFGVSCNLGVAAATGEVVVLLNNDVQPEKQFFPPLLKHFSHPMVFAVGCREENREGASSYVGGRGVAAFRRGLVVHWRPMNQDLSLEVLWVSGGSAAFRRDKWVELGGFDRLFRPAYEEDRDLSWQALKAGYKLFFEPRARVIHRHETTNMPTFGKWRMEVYSFKNQLLFVWKNISSPRLLVSHLVWLPYHLVITTLKTKGKFLLAFLFACWQLPEAISVRIRASRHWRRSDEEILATV